MNRYNMNENQPDLHDVMSSLLMRKQVAEKDLAALNKATDLYYQERKLQLEANIDFYCRTFELLRRYKNLLEQQKK